MMIGSSLNYINKNFMRKLPRNKFLSKLSSVRTYIVIIFGVGIMMPLSQSYVFAQTKPINENSNPTPIILKVQQVADNLETLTDIVFPGNGDIWVTE